MSVAHDAEYFAWGKERMNAVGDNERQSFCYNADIFWQVEFTMLEKISKECAKFSPIYIFKLKNELSEG